jgi:hypothetical protein
MRIHVDIFGRVYLVEPLLESDSLAKAADLAVRQLGYKLGDNQFEFRNRTGTVVDAKKNFSELGIPDGDIIYLNFPGGLDPTGAAPDIRDALETIEGVK